MEGKEIINLMQESKLFAGFSNSECEQLRALLQPVQKEYVPQQIVISEGEPVSQIGIIVGGRFMCTKFYYTGNKHIVSVLMPGELVGIDGIFTSSKQSPVTVTAQTRSALLVFDVMDFLSNRILDSEQQIHFMDNLLHLLGNNGVRQMYKIEILSKRSLRDRIMTFFSVMSKKRNSDTFAIRMNQEQMSHFLCVNRSALSSELNWMKKEGIISFRRDIYTINREHPAWKITKQ